MFPKYAKCFKWVCNEIVKHRIAEDRNKDNITGEELYNRYMGVKK